MTKNVGHIDKIVRIVTGVGLLSLIGLLEGNVRWVGLLGLIPLGTAALGNCPLYSLLGISTCPAKKD